MQPLKRPFADWVDDRVIPAYQWFRELHPWIWRILSFAAGAGLLAAARGEWLLVAVSAGVWAVVGVCFWLSGAIRQYAWARERRVDWMRANHICLNCGYDMRATPQRCSECGRWAGGESGAVH